MIIALAQTSPRLNRTNLHSVVSTVDKVKQDCDLVVFPELALSGYLLQDKLYEDAWELSELDLLRECSLHVDIAVGAAIREGNFFRNAALYFSGGELLSQHYKVHLPNYGMFEEARYFEAGADFEIFSTKFGRACMVVCEDLWRENTHKILKEKNPDHIFVLAASPSRGFRDGGMDIQERWYDILKSIAKECRAKVVFVNRVGFEDGLGFWGGSCIVNEDMTIDDTLPRYKEALKIYEI